MSRILFEKKFDDNNNNCLIEWRQMTHGGDNQDVWAIDDITIRDIIPRKFIEKNFHRKLIYIRPGFILTFRLEAINSKVQFNVNDVRTKRNTG